MGYGSYSHEAHIALTKSRTSVPRQTVFAQRSCHPLMNPKGVRVRECRDSADHPNSLAIAFALDVTGSMGHIPDLLARQELPTFMKLLTDFGVADPTPIFVAVGDANSDKASLQVGQFESTAELMDQWLTWTFLEGGGGPGNQESYELALYFLAEHVAMDNMEKRNKRGYMFMTGDELPYPSVSRHQIDSLIGDRLDEDIPTEAVVAALYEQWEPFFLIPDPGRRARCERRWRDLLGDRVLVLEDPADTCVVAAGAVALREGVVANLDALAGRMSESGLERKQVNRAIRALTPFAAVLGKDAAPSPIGAPVASSGDHGADGSWWKRFFGK